MKLKKDHRGASLILVISVIAIVTILATIILAMGLLNYQMKAANRNSKNNFYDAERVLDEIRLGLQRDVSDAMSDAYFETMENYSEKDLDEASKHFKQLYISELRSKIESAQNNNHYDINYLLSFLDGNVRDNTTLTTSEGRNPVLTVSTNGVVLRNLFLSYVDEQNYVTRIGTDIVLLIPDINLSKYHNSSNVVQYVLAAQQGIDVWAGTGTVNLEGNVYGGAWTSRPASENNSFVVPNGRTVNIAAGKDLVAEKSVIVKSGGILNQEEKAAIWANDIEAENISKLQLRGSTYVANDLTLLGGADVTIGGEYYGFGNPKAALQAESVQDLKIQTQIEETPADYSSAIIVNALGVDNKAKLNLKDVKTLMLAGNAYIGDSKVLMGESLTVKSNQIAYLAPESCMMGASNPMTAVSRATRLSTVEGDTERDKEVNFKNQILLRAQTNVSPEVEEIVQMTSQDGLYYYYMRFSNAKAADRYFAAHYQSAASGKIKDYLRYYVDDREVKVNADAKRTANGNILVYDENGISAIGDTIDEGGGDLSENEKIVSRLASYQDIFCALNKNLSVDYASLTNMQKAKDTVFSNLYNNRTMQYELRRLTGYFHYYEGNRHYVAFFGNSVSSLATARRNAQQNEGAELGMIIARNSVVIDDDFEGFILCGGRATIKPKSGVTKLTLKSNPALTAKLINDSMADDSQDSSKVYYLKEFMYDPDRYSGKFYSADNRSDNEIRVEDLVVYENWSKQ